MFHSNVTASAAGAACMSNVFEEISNKVMQDAWILQSLPTINILFRSHAKVYKTVQTTHQSKIVRFTTTNEFMLLKQAVTLKLNGAVCLA